MGKITPYTPETFENGDLGGDIREKINNNFEGISANLNELSKYTGAGYGWVTIPNLSFDSNETPAGTVLVPETVLASNIGENNRRFFANFNIISANGSISSNHQSLRLQFAKCGVWLGTSVATGTTTDLNFPAYPLTFYAKSDARQVYPRTLATLQVYFDDDGNLKYTIIRNSTMPYYSGVQNLASGDNGKFYWEVF